MAKKVLRSKAARPGSTTTARKRPRPPRQVPAYVVVSTSEKSDPKVAAAVVAWLANRIR